MFGFLKRKVEPVGPFGFDHVIEIERPAAEVYSLIDWADARNAKRALGNKVEQVGSSPDRFRMQLDMLPDLTFEMLVTAAAAGETYAFENGITPLVGRLVGSHETYCVEAVDERSCRLRLRVEANFVDGLPDEEIAAEVIMMSFACENALAKLKLQAERGVEAVHALEAMQMDGDLVWQ